MFCCQDLSEEQNIMIVSICFIYLQLGNRLVLTETVLQTERLDLFPLTILSTEISPATFIFANFLSCVLDGLVIRLRSARLTLFLLLVPLTMFFLLISLKIFAILLVVVSFAICCWLDDRNKFSSFLNGLCSLCCLISCLWSKKQFSETSICSLNNAKIKHKQNIRNAYKQKTNMMTTQNNKVQKDSATGN